MRPTQLEIGTHDEGLAECGVLLDPRCEGCMYADFFALGLFWDGERPTKVDVHSTYIYFLKQ